MSVFTPLDESDIRQLLTAYALGDLQGFRGIAGGSENTNYFVDLADGRRQNTRLVLTLVERGPVQDLPFFIQLLACLQQAGLPVPYAITDTRGIALHQLKNRPALLQPCLPGEHPEQPTVAQCAALGTLLARLHTASAGCGLQRENDRNPAWVLTQAQQLLASEWQAEADWLAPALNALQQWYDHAPALPQAIIHGDLFRDNAMLVGNDITGIIDFYNAATGWTLMELAICVNDWCVSATSSGELQIDGSKVDALLGAYDVMRPLTPDERQSWPCVLQLAALRFWVSRQQYARQHRGHTGVLIKDPGHFRQLYRLHTRQSST